jgi:4-hydroxy-3-polyprenylbenzoate decarboxylase
LGIKNPRLFMPGVLVLEGLAFWEGETNVDLTKRSGDALAEPLRGLPSFSTRREPRPPGARPYLAERIASSFDRNDPINAFPLIVLVDSSEFTARSTENFLWTVFTKSNPATDVFGIEAFNVDKHWGCRGSLVIDARSKPHHAPPLLEDPKVTARIDALAVQGGPLHGIV